MEQFRSEKTFKIVESNRKGSVEPWWKPPCVGGEVLAEPKPKHCFTQSEFSNAFKAVLELLGSSSFMFRIM